MTQINSTTQPIKYPNTAIDSFWIKTRDKSGTVIRASFARTLAEALNAALIYEAPQIAEDSIITITLPDETPLMIIPSHINLKQPLFEEQEDEIND